LVRGKLGASGGGRGREKRGGHGGVAQPGLSFVKPGIWDFPFFRLF